MSDKDLEQNKINIEVASRLSKNESAISAVKVIIDDVYKDVKAGKRDNIERVATEKAKKNILAIFVKIPAYFIVLISALGLFFTGITAFQGHLSNLEALERQQAVRDETINSNRAINNRKQKG